MFKAIVLICALGSTCEDSTVKIQSPSFDNELQCMHQWQEWYAKLAIRATEKETIKVECKRIKE